LKLQGNELKKLAKIQEMFQKLTTGEAALALGALEANVELAFGYPGIPGARIFEHLISQSFQFRVQVQWTTNAKWALEQAYGASMMGSRVLIGLDPKAFYEAFDPFEFLLQTRLQAGVVLILGDQQDSIESIKAARPHFFKKIPLFEPIGPIEGREMLLEAYRLSETYQLPVMLRINHFFQQRKELVPTSAEPAEENGTLEPLSLPFAPGIGEEHLKRSLSEIGQLFELSPFNRVEGEGPIGIVAVGLTYQKVIEVLDNNFNNRFCVLKLGTLNPIPQATIGYFLENVKTAIILEENAPLIERQILELAKFQGIKITILGRESQHVGQEKILYHWQIEEILASVQPRFRPLKKFYSFQKIAHEKHDERFCEDCHVTRTLTNLAQTLNSHFPGNLPYIVRDNLCHEIPKIREYPNTFAPYPGNMVIGLASGIARIQKGKPVIVMIESGAFIHHGINSLISATQIKVNLIILILEKLYPESPAQKQKYLIDPELMSTTMPLENLISVCDVTLLKIIDHLDKKTLTSEWLEALELPGIKIFIVRNTCPTLR
jgi:indolepyruvate ferredoxin oxidoreductase alpha subunit